MFRTGYSTITIIITGDGDDGGGLCSHALIVRALILGRFGDPEFRLVRGDPKSSLQMRKLALGEEEGRGRWWLAVAIHAFGDGDEAIMVVARVVLWLVW